MKQFENTIKEKSQALDSIKIKLDQGRKRIADLDKKEGLYLEQLELLEKNIEVSQVFLTKINEKIDTLSRHIAILHVSLKKTGEELIFRQKKMKTRLRNFYKTEKPSIFEILLTSTSIIDILNKVRYFHELKQYDLMLAHSIDSTKSLIKLRKDVLEIEQDELTELKASKEDERAQLKSEQKQRQSVLDEVKDEKAAYIAMVKELEQAQQDLNQLVKALERKRVKIKKELEQDLKIGFEKRKGKLPWPVSGTVMKEFGKIVHPKYKTVTVNDGIDIKTTKGSKVYCVAPGKIELIGSMRGYGKMIIVNHFGGYLTVYTHLDKIKVFQNQEVSYGQEIGLAGETGSLDGPKLHFQIRDSQKWLNPRDWLESKE